MAGRIFPGIHDRSGVVPLFSLPLSSNGVDNLNPSLTINGTTVSPSLRYKGGDATASIWPAWTFGNSLAIAGSGTVPSLNQGSPLLGSSSDDSVKGEGGKYFQASSSTDGDVALEDCVFEIVFKCGGGGGPWIKGNVSSGSGWRLFCSGTFLQLTLADGTNFPAHSSKTLVLNTWYHIIIFVDRSGSMQFYINGIVDTNAATVVSGMTGSITNSGVLKTAQTDAGTIPWLDNIAYFSMWKSTNWLDSHLQPTVAAQRFGALSGIYPSRFHGTDIPTTQTRATIAMLDKYEGSTKYLYQVGDHWMRLCQQADSSNNTLTGFRVESTTANLAAYSQTLSQAPTWSGIDTGDLWGSTLSAAPDKSLTVSGIIADNSNNQHGVSTFINPGSASTTTFSCFARPGNRTWLYMEDKNVANANCYFDISNGVVGTAGAGVISSFIESWGSSWYRCGFSFTGANAVHTFQISPAAADTNNIITGDSVTENIYVWGVQVEVSLCQTSYIATTTAQTRNGDALVYSATNNINTSGGTVVAKVLTPNYSNVGTNKFVGTISDNTANNFVRMFLRFTSGKADIDITTAGGVEASVISTSDLTNNIINTISFQWGTNNASVAVNGASEGTPDTSVTVPAGLTDIDVGVGDTEVGQLDGLISALKIYPKITGKT